MSISDYHQKLKRNMIKKSLDEILHLEDSTKPMKISIDEFFVERAEINRKKYGSPKNTFERNYNKLYKEFKSTDLNSFKLNTSNSSQYKRLVTLESEEKLNLKALQSQIENKSKTYKDKDVKTKLKEMKIGCLTQNFIQSKSGLSGTISGISGDYPEESTHRRLYSASIIPIPTMPYEFLSKTETKLKKNDFISDKMKSKLIDVYKKANQSGIFETELNRNSSLLTEMMPIGCSPSFNYTKTSANTGTNMHRSKSSFFIIDFIESSPNKLKVKLVQKEITSMLNGGDYKQSGVLSKIRSICDDNPKSSLRGDYKTFLNFGNDNFLNYYVDNWNIPNNDIVSKIVRKFPEVVRSKNSFGFKRIVSLSKS